ncbi:MAG: hypothetical protein AAB385_02740 [Planctomycetota bacterium]|jgi:hypothetical protein
MAVSVRLEFIYTPLFEASAKGLLDEEAMRQLETTLLRDPQQGDVVAGTGGEARGARDGAATGTGGLR